MKMTSRFRLVFWGLLFAFLALRINNFDILPDVIGYILLAMGCGELARVSYRFTVSQCFCLVLAVLSVLPNWFIGVRVKEFGWLVDGLQCGLIGFLLGGVMVLAAAGRRPDLVRNASRLCAAYVGFSVLHLLLDGISSEPLSEIFIVFSFVISMCVLLSIILILLFIRRLTRELAPGAPDGGKTLWPSEALSLLTLLAACGVWVFLMNAHSGYKSTMFCGANFHAKDPQGADVVFSDLKKLLDAKGFSSTYNPTEMDRFAGMHSAEAQDIWLKSGREEFKGIFLRLQKMPSSISLDTKWEHDGFKKDAIRTERRAYEVSLEIARWFHSRPEKESMPSEIEDSGIKYFEKSLEKLRVE